MFWNNVKIALRNVRKNKLFAAINIAGLALGLSIYVFGGLVVNYEKTHDSFFAYASRVFTIGSVAAPGLNVGIDRINATWTTIGPIIEAELKDVEAVARVKNQEYLLTMGAESFYQNIRFADPAFLDIFDFNYLYGDATAIDNPSGLLVTESVAVKYFGKADVIGQVVTFDNEFDFYVAAVVEDVPLNSHFNSAFVVDHSFGIVAPLRALQRMRDWDIAGNWENLSLGDMTYVMLPDTLNADWLRTQIDNVYERHVPDEAKEVISDFIVYPLSDANISIWDAIGMPVIEVVALLSLLVLIIACVNYTNLATAQALGRSREVGMRKTMGASQRQLLTQFLIESLVIAAIAMLFAVALLEIVIPLFNSVTNKSLTLHYVDSMPWLVLTTILVGLIAGLYPAWLITRASPIDALRDIARKGKKGARMRSFMIGAQFAISAFMLAIVTLSYMQNQRVQESSYVFPRAEIYTIDRLQVEGIADRLDTLKIELEALPNVDSVSFSSQVPYEQNNNRSELSMQPGDESATFHLQLLQMSPDFLETYDIPILAGRNMSRDIGNDVNTNDTEILNVLINEMALPLVGAASAADAINKRFYDLDEGEADTEFIVVGVVPTQNIVGLFNQEKPWMYIYDPDALRIGSIRITGGNIMDSVENIETVWDRVIRDYPMQGRFLDDVFNDVYNVLKYMNMALAGFAFIALALALIGLFGLAAFMAAQRTNEIGVRKVLGASSLQIARLLVWQFSRPVMWALVVALPAAFFASQQYLNFFADRIEAPIPILLVAGAIAVLLAWATVAAHAFRIARSNPVMALRYE
jgi:putative ABC transport system permease protein